MFRNYNLSVPVMAVVATMLPVVAFLTQDFSLSTLIAPHFWIMTLSALGLMGLTLGDGLGSRNLRISARRFNASDATTEHPGQFAA